MLNKFLSGVCAGILIAVGGTVYLSCHNKYIGAVLFSVALLCICLKGYSLFTGKIGFIPEKHGREELSVLFLGLLGNAAAVFVCGIVLNIALPGVGEAATEACSSKLCQPLYSSLVRSIFCGILMYLAVSIYRDRGKLIGVLFCIPVFILCGFEHSVADMFYFALAGKATLRTFAFLGTVLIGNSAGAMLLPVLGGKLKNEKQS